MLLAAAVTTPLVVVAPPAQAAACPNGWVALTFDDGPHPVVTPQILSTLRSRDAVATIFPNGARVSMYPEIARRAWYDGHNMANHGWFHSWFTRMSDADIRWSLHATYHVLIEAGAHPIRLFRPPFGDTSPRVRNAVSAAGFTEILWTVDPWDFRNGGAHIRDHVLSRLSNGAVILLHDTSQATASVIGQIVDGIRARGFCLGLLDATGAVVDPRPAVTTSGVALCPKGATCSTVAFHTIDGMFEVWKTASGAVLDRAFSFGNPGDVAMSGDWNCNGKKTPGLYRRSNGYVYLRNSITQGNADRAFYFGNPGDLPIAGDWNGDGCDTVSVYRPSTSTFHIVNQLGSASTGLGAADYSFTFGNPGDRPFSGDFDGDGIDTVGLFRPSTGLVYYRNSNSSGPAHRSFVFGNPGDVIIAGDWNGNGIDTVAAYRPSNGVLYLRNSNSQGTADAWAWVGRRLSVINVDR